jgi:hypothetical protein
MTGDIGDELLDLGKEVLESIRFGDKVLGAVRSLHRERFKLFLGALGYAHDDLSEDQRAYFERSLQSPDGQALLADYVATTLRSRSTMAIAVMAILFGDSHRREYEQSFKEDVTVMLNGVSDRELQAFLALWSAKSLLQQRSIQWGECFVNEETVSAAPALQRVGYGNDDWISTVNDLISRGVLDRQSSIAPIMTEGEWGCVFRFTKSSAEIAGLLHRARRYLGLPEID